jgi:predicted RNase H-like HicB family nuclease
VHKNVSRHPALCQLRCGTDQPTAKFHRQWHVRAERATLFGFDPDQVIEFPAGLPAFENLRRSLELGWRNFQHMEQDTDLDSIRADPRYKELLQKYAKYAVPPDKGPVEKPKTYIFDVTIEQDEFEDGQRAYHASCPALKGCHSWGHTYEEALANVREAVELYVEDMIESGEQIPVGSRKGVVVRSTPAVVVNV